jgi:antitoxin VapB
MQKILCADDFGSICFNIYTKSNEVLMIEARVAKLFKNGASQAVRLPVDFRFEGDEVYITRDEATGDVVLSSRPGGKVWADFFDLLEELKIPEDFMAERPLNILLKNAGVFDE